MYVKASDDPLAKIIHTSESNIYSTNGEVLSRDENMLSYCNALTKTDDTTSHASILLI